MKIGSHKEEVLDTLVKNNDFSYIRAEIGSPISFWGRAENIKKIDDLVLDQKRVFVELKEPKRVVIIYFLNNSISRISSGSVDDLGLTLDMSRLEVRALLLHEISKSRIKRIYNFLPGADWTELRNLSKFDKEFLLIYDIWNLGQTGVYSSTKLIFVNNLLYAIEYKWTPFELP
ncbi:MAG: hypothetical protein GY820_44710 [Gammaproteobacteria bacterium]|nr:hypothetical protein [Gammaproteobacteria bacterium]